jgi:hypothetical protein
MTITPTHHLPRQLTRLARVVHADALRADLRAELHADLDLTDPSSSSSPRRVRHEVRDGVAVMAFSAAASTGVALMLLLFTRVAG